jgi:hypothetical protein
VRQVRWLNATLRLQAACMADATTCDDYARCRKLLIGVNYFCS